MYESDEFKSGDHTQIITCTVELLGGKSMAVLEFLNDQLEAMVYTFGGENAPPDLKSIMHDNFGTSSPSDTDWPESYIWHKDGI